MSLIAVIDTETNWYDEVMSIGVVAADSLTMQKKQWRYYILDPECRSEGMYSDRMDLADPADTRTCSRPEAMEDLRQWLEELGIREIFAYNARFDCHHLPELKFLQWYDIMKIAAYRQSLYCR